MSANSNERSSYVKFDRNAKTEGFKRPNHNDFCTSTELRDRKFAGWRANQISNLMELWIEGRVVATCPARKLEEDPAILEKIQAEYFGLI